MRSSDSRGSGSNALALRFVWDIPTRRFRYCMLMRLGTYRPWSRFDLDCTQKVAGLCVGTVIEALAPW